MRWVSGAVRRRAKLAAKAPEGPLRDYLSVPAAGRSTPLNDGKYLAVDVETTGLDPRSDALLSIGFVPIDGRRIVLGGSSRIVVRGDTEVGMSARFHGLTDDAIARGIPLEEAMDRLFTALTGRVMLAHHAAIETGFLDRACRTVYGISADFAVIDTMALQADMLTKGFDDEPPPGSLRLWAACGQYGLPRYTAHDALADALACAELFLAQSAELQTDRTKTLAAVLAN